EGCLSLAGTFEFKFEEKLLDLNRSACLTFDDPKETLYQFKRSDRLHVRGEWARGHTDKASTVRATVHVVDDDASFRSAIGRLLRLSGYTVILHESAEHLLAHLPNETGRCCLLLDVVIPGLSGPELHNRLTERGLKVPTIFLTGSEDVSAELELR